MDEHGQAALPEQLHQRMHRRVVRVVAVDQRMELQAEELRMVEEPLRLLAVAGQARVRPNERVSLRNRLDDRPHILVVGMEDTARLVVVLGK